MAYEADLKKNQMSYDEMVQSREAPERQRARATRQRARSGGTMQRWAMRMLGKHYEGVMGAMGK